MQAAYLKRQDASLWPLRRLEAAMWNVQSAKVNGEQFEPFALYPLSIDPPKGKKKQKNNAEPATNGRLSREEYQKMMERRFPQIHSPQPAN